MLCRMRAFIALLSLLVACAAKEHVPSAYALERDAPAVSPWPEASKRFLKLRGYNFDDQSFLSAANAGDELAVKGFISAGINLNARDENGDTALTAAAARGAGRSPTQPRMERSTGRAAAAIV